jgi:molybdopterin converting factor small subunit
MSIKVLIPESFQTATGGINAVEVKGKTIGECLVEAVEKFPGLQKLWFKEKGKLASYLLILLNGEKVHNNNLSQTVKDKDEIYPLLVIGGG